MLGPRRVYGKGATAGLGYGNGAPKGVRLVRLG